MTKCATHLLKIMWGNLKFRITQNIETNKSILWYRELSVIIFTKYETITQTNIWFTKESQEI